jgi:hypothetical protein
MVMRAHVLAASVPGESTRVRTAHGDLTGSWKGRDPVEAGAEVDVELSTSRPYHWTEIRRVPDGAAGFRITDDGHVEVIGEVVDYDQYDVITLRAGGALLLIDTEGDAPLGITGTTVRVIVDDLRIYPTNA